MICQWNKDWNCQYYDAAMINTKTLKSPPYPMLAACETCLKARSSAADLRSRELSHQETEKRRPFNDEMQIIAANVDTVLLVQSCNTDVNLRRLERYLELHCGEETKSKGFMVRKMSASSAGFTKCTSSPTASISPPRSAYPRLSSRKIAAPKSGRSGWAPRRQSRQFR